MAQDFPHLTMQRETPVTGKRPGKYIPPPPPSDVRGHSLGLLRDLADAKQQARRDLGGFDDRKLIKFSVDKGFNPDDLSKISRAIEFVSQEEETVVIGFASDAALADFEKRLTTMARGESVTYRQVFYALRGIDGWSLEDRKGWALKSFGFPETDEFLLDVELWPLEEQPESRALEGRTFEAWLSNKAILKKDKVIQPGLILYRVLCTIEQAELLLRNRDVRCVDLPPSFRLERFVVSQDLGDLPEIQAPSIQAPGVVVLDSGLATGHVLLKAAVGEAKSFLPGESANDENGHGTHVSGLALYGDFEHCLRTRSFVPALRLFSGRILDKENTNNTDFIENYIEEAVRYFKERKDCKIFNLSIGDSSKPYLGGHIKGLSVVLDTLSRELDIVFIVSVGNHCIGEDSPAGLDWRDHCPHYLLRDSWRIIEPATAINALTVGSLARHNQTFNSQRYLQDPSELPVAPQPDQPSPFTRAGPSVDGAIKPELLAYGGNWAINTRAGYSLIDQPGGLGVVSTEQNQEGSKATTKNGTSMAAPQVAHMAASVLLEHPEANANFIRALLCLNAVIPYPCQKLIEQNKEFRRVCGYGKVEECGLFRSTENIVTIKAEEAIANKTHHFYEIPLPSDFVSGGKRRPREIAVALAYTPPVRSTRMNYRATRIEFRLVASPDLDHVITMFNNATLKSDYKNIPELKTGRLHGPDARSKGTVQADFWRFVQFNADSKLRNQKLFVVVTRNDFPWGEHLCNFEENYSLLVSLRDRENENAQLYTQIKAQLETKLRLRARV
jgi:hypothetical protein